MKLILTRGVLRAECPWLDDNMAEGTVVYLFSGCTYGCIGRFGMAVSMAFNTDPFFELPREALMPLELAFRGRVCDTRGYVLAMSEPCVTRLQAARSVMMMRRRAKTCSTSYCTPEGADGHRHIIWHDREDVFKPD
jgi:hypothetical protein